MPRKRKYYSRKTKDEIATFKKDPDIFTGYLKRLENPDTVLNTESGGRGIKLYDDVDRDGQAGTVLQTRYLAIVGKEWEILPASENKRDIEIADFVKNCFLNTNFDQARQELLKGILYGFYVSEVIWTIKDGKYVIDKIRGKHPRRFIFTPERELRMLTLENLIEGEEIPGKKFIIFTYGSSDNPYGDGLGKKLYWYVWFKKNGIKFWLTYLDKFGSPTTIGKYPQGQADKKDILSELLDDIQNNSGISMPDSLQIELLEASRSGNITYEKACQYFDATIAKIVLGQTLTSDIDKIGSYAASKVHNEVRQDILKADADALCECLNQSLIPWLVDYNYWNVSEYPKIWIRTTPEQDLKPLAERDKILTKDIGLPVSQKYFYETYGIEEPQKSDILINEQPIEENAMKFNEYAVSNITEDQKTVDYLTNTILEKNWKPIANPILQPIKKLIGDADNYYEVKEKLKDLLGELNTDELQKMLQKLMFISENQGRLSVTEEIK